MHIWMYISPLFWRCLDYLTDNSNNLTDLKVKTPDEQPTVAASKMGVHGAGSGWG